MTDSTIANLTSGSPAQASDVLPIQRGATTLKLAVSDLTLAGSNVPTAGSTSPSPAFPVVEAPTSVNPSIYVQDINGAWHQQAGIDTTTNPNNYPNSGPTGPLGTLLWTRRQYHRDNLSSVQTDRNTFNGFNHAFGVGTSQENQDSNIGMWQQNGTMTISGGTVSAGVVQFNVGQSGWIVPGQIYTPAGLATLTQLNNVPLQVTSLPSNLLVQLKAAPFTLHVANNASAGTTTYAGYINRGTNTLVGQTVVIAGFTNAANNGTFTVTANVQTGITVNNPSGVSESPVISIIPTATVVIANVAQTADTGTLDQYFYGLEGIQAELDVYGTPTFTSAVDGEVSTLSAQINALNPSNVSVPNFGYNGLRVTATKSGAGQLNGNAFAISGVNASVHINNTANNGAGVFPAILTSVQDAVGGAPSSIGAGVYCLFNGANRLTLRNYGLFTQDYSKAYSVTSVANASGGQTVYNGTFPTTGSLAGQQFKVTGFTNAANNGTFTCNSNTSSTMTLANTVGVAETKTVTVQALNDWSIYSTGGQVYLGGNISFYNGQTTAGNGIAAEVNQVASSALGANFNAGAARTIFTPTVNSQLRISFSQALTQAATVSSTMPSLILSWTDVGGIARTKTLAATDSTNLTTAEYDGVAVITTNGSTVVQITSAGYATSGATSMQYALSVTTEVL